MIDRKTLCQYESEANDVKAVEVRGKSAAVCPYCGGGMFVNGTRKGDADKSQCVWCRNKNCGKKFKVPCGHK